MGAAGEWGTRNGVVQVEREGCGSTVLGAGQSAVGLEGEGHVIRATLEVGVIPARWLTVLARGEGGRGVRRGADKRADSQERDGQPESYD